MIQSLLIPLLFLISANAAPTSTASWPATTETPTINTTETFETTTVASNTTEAFETTIAVSNTTEAAETTTETLETTTEAFNIVCPESTDGHPVFLPYPRDCTKYYECDGDWAILMDCAPPLYFDASLSVCNWPDLVNCTQSTQSFEARATNESTTVEADTTMNNNATTEAAETTTEVVETTAAAVETTTEAVETTTEAVETTTEAVETTAAAVETTTEGIETTTEAVETTTEVVETTTAAVETTTEAVETTTEAVETTTEAFNVVCPESTDGFPVFLPYPKDCTKYYECDGDWPILMDCAPPLYFDAELNVCNWPDQVNCDQSSQNFRSRASNESTTADAETTIENTETTKADETTAAAVETTTEAVETTTEAVETTTEAFNVVCPESKDGFPVFLPYPRDCTKYYECDGDWPILMDCAPPLYFDATLSVCNWPDQVKC